MMRSTRSREASRERLSLVRFSPGRRASRGQECETKHPSTLLEGPNKTIVKAGKLTTDDPMSKSRLTAVATGMVSTEVSYHSRSARKSAPWLLPFLEGGVQGDCNSLRICGSMKEAGFQAAQEEDKEAKGKNENTEMEETLGKSTGPSLCLEDDDMETEEQLVQLANRKGKGSLNRLSADLSNCATNRFNLPSLLFSIHQNPESSPGGDSSEEDELSTSARPGLGSVCRAKSAGSGVSDKGLSGLLSEHG
ncbi:unnamed protein product [Protopolystoma xenopodis]|uniref:Uncharacterized protein n=1 Tax=Protopolystoma xenopodis TaxID=117903 RepID=A0A3S5CLF3_9PLAT|nr:unnamed protein product [Protopolystoma xenopodis]